MSRESDLNELRGQALAAYQEGRPVFIARFKSGTWGTKVGQMPEWEDNLDAVESAGWVLDEWSTTVDMGGVFNAFPVFRRGDASPPPQDTR
jgi:hypothetical protein